MSLITAEKKVSLKKTVYFVIVLCAVCSLVSGALVYAYSPGNFQVISGGVYPGAPSYTVFEDSGTYYVKDEFGYVAYSAADASTVFNNIFDSLVTGTGISYTIKVLSGTYTFGSSVTIEKLADQIWDTAIKIEGQTEMYGTNFVKDFDGDLFTIGDGTNRIGYITFKGIYFEGGDNSGALISSNTINSLNLEYCTFDNNNGAAISTLATWGGPCIWNRISVTNCGNATVPAVNIDGNSNAITIIDSSIAANNGVGIEISSDSSSITISYNIAENKAGATYPVIRDYGLETRIIGCSLSYAEVGYNVIELLGTRTVCSSNTLTATGRWGTAIYVGTGFVGGTITANHIHDSGYGVYISSGYPSVSANSFVDNNIGVYVNYTFATISGNSYYNSRYQSIYLLHGDYTGITGEIIINTGFGSGASSYSAIYLSSSLVVNVGNIQVRDFQGTVTTKYGVEEAGTSNDNIISNINAWDTGSYGIKTVGVASHVLNSWNGTNTWLANSP